MPRLPCLSFWGIPSDFWLLVYRPRMHPRASRAPGPFCWPFSASLAGMDNIMVHFLAGSKHVNQDTFGLCDSLSATPLRGVFLLGGGGQAPKAATAIVCLYTARHCHSPGHYCKEKRPKHRPFAGPPVFGFLSLVRPESREVPWGQCKQVLELGTNRSATCKQAAAVQQMCRQPRWVPGASKLCCGTRAASGMLELSWAAFVSSTPNLCIFTSLGPLFQGSEHKHHRNTQALEVRRVICS